MIPQRNLNGLNCNLKRMKLICMLIISLFTTLVSAQSNQKMLLSENEKKDLFGIVEDLMNEANIEIRDTWKGWLGFNYDDFYSNGNSYGGKKLIEIVTKEDGMSGMEGNKIYKVPNFKSAGYDNVKIKIPKRLSHLKHPIVHELVHFLQHTTVDLDKEYIPYNPNRYKEYVGQRIELEAHYIQLLFIERYELKEIGLDEEVENEFIKKVKESFSNPDFKLELILYARFKKII